MTNGLVSCEWLREHLADAQVRVVDATYFLPTEGKNAVESYAAAHIDSAVFFDIDACCDVMQPYPHMLPNAEIFSDVMSALGITRDHHVVVYDQKGLFSAARLWWMLQVFGHDAAKVSVLDGGLPRWQSLGYAVSDVLPQVSRVEYGSDVTLKHMVCSQDDVMYALDTHDAVIVDARGAARFDGAVAEPRAGVRSGHIPTSVNVPYSSVLNADATMKSAVQLQELFVAAGVDETTVDVIASCGSGVTACVLVLALRQIGHERVRVYDGSWAQWGAQSDTPVEVTPVRCAA
jgi:thiosulfate/3-mercaptopyruvate sulfurtransferase